MVKYPYKCYRQHFCNTVFTVYETLTATPDHQCMHVSMHSVYICRAF